jgi:hypothetical protein
MPNHKHEYNTQCNNSTKTLPIAKGVFRRRVVCEKQPRIPCVSPRLPPLTPPPEIAFTQGIRGCFSQAIRRGDQTVFSKYIKGYS